MGYTHYWAFRPVKGEVRAYKSAIIECQKIVRAYSIANGGLAGYAAHTEPGTYGGINVNGSRENGHESFVLRETYAEACESGKDFCKTARKPYDIVVVACLCVLQARLGDAIAVSSDGYSLDWIAGLELAQRVLKDKKIAMPRAIRRRLAVI